jgi:hypothetical protein
MFIPSLLLGLVVSSLLAAAWHVGRGQALRDLAEFWLMAQAGFWGAHLIAAAAMVTIGVVGELQLGAGVVGGAIALSVLVVRRK